MRALAALGLWVGMLAATAPGARAEEAPAPSGPWSPSAAEGWRTFEHGDLLVKPGSALDFSSLVEEGPAGKHGFVTVNKDGQLAFADNPAKPVRFFCCAEPMEYWTPTTKPELAEYARQAKLAGYNCFRTHFLDLMLMIGTKDDFVVSPEQMDRWDYYSAELKKQGIYLLLDVTTSWATYYASPVKGASWSPAGRAVNLYGKMYWDPAARAHWEKAVHLILEHVNPYTGMALKDEPQVVSMQLRNEAALHFLLRYENKDKSQETGLIGPFREWLATRYGTVEKLNAAWKTSYTAFSEIPFSSLDGVSPPTADLQRFLTDAEGNLWDWMVGVMHGIGVRNLMHDYNAGNEFAFDLTRSRLPLVDTHSYHDHPTSYVSAGSTMTNQSAVGQGFPYVTWTNEVRQLDRPFIVSEWGSPYWNQWRYEAGLGMPAYGAFQDWQLLDHAHEPIKIKAEVSIRPFKIGFDPPGRLSERMSALLFARGDVSPSRHTVAVQLDPDAIFTRLGGQGYFPPAIRRLTFLVKEGIQIVDYPPMLPGAPVKADATLRAASKSAGYVWADDPGTVAFGAADKATPVDQAAMADALRKRGLLPPGNKTDPAAGVFQSDTGELTLSMKTKTMLVDTPRSQAAALPEGSAEARLKDVTILNQGESGCFFVSALDAQPLEKSRRVLILAVGDAVNTGAVFADKNRKVLQTLGTLPVLVKPLKCAITLRRSLAPGEKAKLWALAWNGDRVAEVPVQVSPDGLQLNLDTGALPNPVFQYELAIGPDAE